MAGSWRLVLGGCLVHGSRCSAKDNEQRDPPLRDGLNETAVSVVENISEGFEREGRKEFAQFTRIAKGSNGEGRGLLYLAQGRGYLSEQEFARLLGRYIRIGKMLRSLYAHLSQPHR